VTCPICLNLLDYYEIVKDKSILDVVESSIKFLIEDNGYKEFDNGICFYYSDFDKHLVHNSNLFAALLLIRFGKIMDNKEYIELGKKAYSFSISKQSKDGSWRYYIIPVKGKEDKIDNRHSGFNIECLQKIYNLNKDPMVLESLKKSISYYKSELFWGDIPKWSSTQVFPVDIHDVAQSIITLTLIGEMDFAKRIIDFAVTDMFDGKDSFYYKLSENKKPNKAVFFRWNQAWMYLAISLYLKNQTQNKGHKD